MKAKTAHASFALVAMLVAGTVTTTLAQDGKYRLSGSDRYSKVATDARLARLKDANDRFNRNYGKGTPGPKPTAIRINEAQNRVKPFQKNTATGGIGSSASATRPNTPAGKNMTTARSATGARPNSLGSKGMTTARTATNARPINSAVRGASAYRNVQTARSAKQIGQGVKAAKTVAAGAKTARLAMGATGVAAVGFIATEIVIQEIEDPGKTLRDINGTAKDIQTGQFLPKAGQKVTRAVNDTGKWADQAGKDVGNFFSGIFGKKR